MKTVSRTDIEHLKPGLYKLDEEPHPVAAYDPRSDEWGAQVVLQAYVRIKDAGPAPDGVEDCYTREDGMQVIIARAALTP